MFGSLGMLGPTMSDSLWLFAVCVMHGATDIIYLNAPKSIHFPKSTCPHKRGERDLN
jgi:hypothetical protein